MKSDRPPSGWPFHMTANDPSVAENSILGIDRDRLRFCGKNTA